MRSSTRRALATLAIAGTLPLSTATAAHAETTTVHEKGLLIECTGTWEDQPVHVSVYENRAYVNELVIAIGDEDDEVFLVENPEDRMVTRGEVHESGRLDGRKFALAGPVVRDGDVVEVHEEFVDDGQQVVVDGVHKPLAADLELTWRKRDAVLDCSNAFRFDLQVSRTPVE